MNIRFYLWKTIFNLCQYQNVSWSDYRSQNTVYKFF